MCFRAGFTIGGARAGRKFVRDRFDRRVDEVLSAGEKGPMGTSERSRGRADRETQILLRLASELRSHLVKHRPLEMGWWLPHEGRRSAARPEKDEDGAERRRLTSLPSVDRGADAVGIPG